MNRHIAWRHAVARRCLVTKDTSCNDTLRFIGYSRCQLTGDEIPLYQCTACHSLRNEAEVEASKELVVPQPWSPHVVQQAVARVSAWIGGGT